MKPHHRLLLGLLLGASTGLVLHPYVAAPWLQAFNQYLLEPLGQLFLRAIFMVVVPLVVCGLVLGVYQLSQQHGLGKIVRRTLWFTILASSASVLIGVALVNILQPGVGVDIAHNAGDAAAITKIGAQAAQAKPIIQSLLETVPKNPLQSAVNALDGEMLSLMFVSLVFGAALAATTGKDEPSRCVALMEEVFASCMLIVEAVMRFAPLAVFALVFQATFKFGVDILLSLGFYALVVLLGLLLQQSVVYTLLLRGFTKRSPWAFYKQCREVYLYAFATASSNATLPRSLALAEHGLGLRPQVSRFVLTVGATANQNGTALFEGITVLFLAQVYGVELSWMQQVQVVLMAILAGIGTAGVPGGSLPLIMLLTQQVGIPAEGMGLILGIDRFLDMCRTTLNVSGDLVIAALVDEDLVVNQIKDLV